jgi:hypothetical protein
MPNKRSLSILIAVVLLAGTSLLVLAGSIDLQPVLDPTPWSTIGHAPDLPLTVQRMQTCQNRTVQTEEPIKTNCTYARTELKCDDEPLNKSCHNQDITGTYECYNGTRTLQSVVTDCTTTGYLVNDHVRINSSQYNCSVEDNGKVYVYCDSIYDGNGDGICQSGESCIRIGIVGGYVETDVRNSQDTFKPADNSFYLAPATAEVLP